MKRLAIIHNMPIAYYPPAFNLMNVAIDNGVDVMVVTTKPQIGHELDCNQSAKICYPFREKRGGNSGINLIRQIYFVIYAVVQLIRFCPDVVLYYESSSAFVPYLYRRLRGNKVVICAHYHEYVEIKEYDRPGMRLQKVARRLEDGYLLKKCLWVSQTNSYRMDFFRKDYPFLTDTQCHVLPNYPPRSWKVDTKLHHGSPVKCVLIGSISLEDTFLAEFCKWVSSQKGKVTVDFYSYNFHKDIKEYFDKLNSSYIRFHSSGIPYQNIPSLLDSYDVGLLLYKSANLNFKYNETNKFYEYLSCGLDVWYPTSMILLNEMDKSVFASNIQSFDVTINKFPCIEAKPRIVDNSQFNLFCEPVYEDFFRVVNLI